MFGGSSYSTLWSSSAMVREWKWGGTRPNCHTCHYVFLGVVVNSLSMATVNFNGAP